MVDQFSNLGDPNPSLNPQELASLSDGTDRLFTFITKKSTKRPENIIYSLNKQGEKQACYTLSFLRIEDQYIFPDLKIIQVCELENGASVFKSYVELTVMSEEEYFVGNLTNRPDRKLTPITTFWIEDCEGFQPMSMSTQFFLDGNRYQLNFNHKGILVEIQTDDLSLIGKPPSIKPSRDKATSYRDQIDIQLFMENLHDIARSNGRHPNLAAAVHNRVDIPMTNYFAMEVFGYDEQTEEAILPLLIYR